MRPGATRTRCSASPTDRATGRRYGSSTGWGTRQCAGRSTRGGGGGFPPQGGGGGGQGDTGGWMGLSRQSTGGAVQRVLRNLVPGEIVLMHLGSSSDRSTIDSKALPAVIRLVRARGYRFVTLAGIRAP